MQNAISSLGREISVRSVPPDDPAYPAALHLALSWPRAGPAADMVARTVEFYDDNQRRGIRSEIHTAASPDGELVNACITLDSPGRAALLVFPATVSGRAAALAAPTMLRVAVDSAWRRPLKLLQILLPPRAEAVRRTAESVGFRFLTTLIYLERVAAPESIQASPTVQDLNWIEYAPENESLFRAAVQSSYTQSLDCPELTGTRDLSEVLAGHRAAGDFHRSLWSVAMRDSSPAAVLLLAHLPKQNAVEVAYMGVSLENRGTGVADAVLHRALRQSAAVGARSLSLAVDERNLPARRLYARWGLRRIAERAAYIATPRPREVCETTHN